MDTDQTIRDLAAFGAFPEATVRACLETPEAVVPRFLDILDRAADGANLPEDDREAIFLIIHILGDLRETRAFRPLINLLRRDDDVVEPILGDSLFETVTQVLISLYDGDITPLETLIGDVEASEWGRQAGLNAWIWLAATGAISRDQARERLLSWYTMPFAKPEHAVWMGWVDAAALLMLEDLGHKARRVFSTGRVTRDMADHKHYLKMLNAARQADDITDVLREERLHPFSDVIDSMSTWHCYSPAYAEERQSRDPDQADREREAALTKIRERNRLHQLGSALVTNRARSSPPPTVNANRTVGRNDPCPCGSGKKYKKCCLGQA